jgi:hypothetical protein
MRNLTPESVARYVARCVDPVPVRVEAGDGPPKQEGESFRYTTPSGKEIRYPHAYKWPKLYHRSTRRVTVGEAWLARHRTEIRIVAGEVVHIHTWARYDFGAARGGAVVYPAWRRRGERCWYVRYGLEQHVFPRDCQPSWAAAAGAIVNMPVVRRLAGAK